MNKLPEKVVSTMLMVCLASMAPAQTGFSKVYLELLSNAEVNARISLSNQQTKAEYDRLHPTKEQIKLMSNAMLYMHPTPWPDSPQKSAALKHCANVLRSAIDTNQIASACNKMTNQPEAVLVLKSVATTAASNLDEFADLLTNTNLMTYLSYWAEISNPTNLFYFSFWSDNGPVRDLDKRPTGGQYILVSARFYENGKLLEFDINSLVSKGVVRTEMQLLLNEDGTLQSFSKRPEETKP
jgi:hypothetical protein